MSAIITKAFLAQGLPRLLGDTNNWVCQGALNFYETKMQTNECNFATLRQGKDKHRF